MATSKRPYKRDDPSAPYGLTREGKPRKRPGPSKGGFKVPGSGRKKVTFSEQMDKWTEDLVEKILSNKTFQQINKFSGKRFSAPASLDLQWEVTKEWFRFKMRQHEREVAEQQIAAALTGTSSELHADRNLARVFAHDIDRRAAEGDPDALAMSASFTLKPRLYVSSTLSNQSKPRCGCSNDKKSLKPILPENPPRNRRTRPHPLAGCRRRAVWAMARGILRYHHPLFPLRIRRSASMAFVSMCRRTAAIFGGTPTA